MEENPNNNKKMILIAAGAVIIILALLALVLLPRLMNKKNEVTAPEVNTGNANTVVSKKEWVDKGAVIAGNYADADIIKIGDSYRIYYGLEPEVQGFKNQIYTAVSKDGITWTDNKEIMTGVTFPSVLKLKDGTYRMYYQGLAEGKSGIMSAVSADGITWTKQEGFRLIAPTTFEGEPVESIAAPTVEILEDGSYLMVYRLSLPKKYKPNVPNQTTSFFLYATSKDGLTWEEKGIAVDSRNETLNGMIDGGELMKWEDGKWRVYFWTYTGVYYVTYENGKFSETSTFEFMTPNAPKNVVFAPNPPGDPTLIKISDKLHMYYGQHQKGIYLATK